MNIDGFFQDGACVQAQIIALLLRDRHEWILNSTWDKEKGFLRGMMSIGRFENCREQGYVVSIRFNGNQRNYAFYEHRNSDSVCLLINDEATINTPTYEMMAKDMEDKWDVDMEFKYGEWEKCVAWIHKDMVENIEKWVEEERREKLEEKLQDGE